MKAINYMLPDGRKGTAYVVVSEQLMPMLREQNIISETDYIIKVDWRHTGKYRDVLTKKMHIVCPYCGTACSLDAQDFGFEEFECDRCECTFTVPENPADLAEINIANLKESTSLSRPSHYRVMLIGEDGQESCLKNGVPAEWADLVLAGFQSQYTEGQKCHLEPEETMADLHRMCEDDRF